MLVNICQNMYCRNSENHYVDIESVGKIWGSDS